jgi:hypothetical protein
MTSPGAEQAKYRTQRGAVKSPPVTGQVSASAIILLGDPKMIRGTGSSRLVLAGCKPGQDEFSLLRLSAPRAGQGAQCHGAEQPADQRDGEGRPPGTPAGRPPPVERGAHRGIEFRGREARPLCMMIILPPVRRDGREGRTTAARRPAPQPVLVSGALPGQALPCGRPTRSCCGAWPVVPWAGALRSRLDGNNQGRAG